jgi:hypothetical protein|eukprot:COSAG01_NODE_4713_length_4797_cov_84.010856_5_plen_70_part_00
MAWGVAWVWRSYLTDGVPPTPAEMARLEPILQLSPLHQPHSTVPSPRRKIPDRTPEETETFPCVVIPVV